MLNYIEDLYEDIIKTKNIRGTDVLYIANTQETDYSKLRHEVGIFPMTFTKYFRVDGNNVEEKLDYLLTKNIQYLNYDQNRICYFLSEEGCISAMITIFKNDDHFIIEVFEWDVEIVLEILAKNNIQFQELDYSCILLEGPSTITFLDQNLNLSVDYFVYQSHNELECCNEEILVARTGYTGEYGYKLLGNYESIKKIWTHIIPKHKEKLIGYSALEICQYEIKQPFWQLEYRKLSDNIFEIDYHWLIDFKKDIEYSGKEALYNVKVSEVKNKLIGAISDVEISINSDVILDGETIGKVVDSRFSFGLQKYIAMLFILKEYAQVNIPLVTADKNNITTISAPYVIPSSWSEQI